MDITRAKSLFIYDREGRLKKVINKLGNGPGEFVKPQDFDIQQGTGNIIILDGDQRKFITYSKDGDFISEISKKNVSINSFLTLNDDKIIIDKGNTTSNDNGDYINFINFKGEEIASFLPVPKYLKNITISPQNPLQRLEDTVLYMPSVHNCLYQIYDNQVQLKYTFDFGDLWPGKQYLHDHQDKHPLQIAQGLVQNYIAFLNYIENETLLFLNFYYKDKQYYYYFNKQSEKTLLFHSTERINLAPIATVKNDFVYVVYMDDANPKLVFYSVKL